MPEARGVECRTSWVAYSQTSAEPCRASRRRWEGSHGVVQVERRLAAIVAADIVGYSRLIESDENGTLAAIKALRREIIDPLWPSITAASSN